MLENNYSGEKSKKKRLDVLLVEQGYAPSREKAKAIIMAGSVFVNGQREDKAGAAFVPEKIRTFEVKGAAIPYVSRGGLKLEKALRVFPLELSGKICMDIGASTGGFTDCMLQNGAEKVYAIDVGHGQLAWQLRNDERVVCMEKTNFRYMKPEDIPDRPAFASCDVSFISLTNIASCAGSAAGRRGDGLSDQAAVRGGTGKSGQEGGGPRQGGAQGSDLQSDGLRVGYRFSDRGIMLFADQRTGGEHRISYLSAERSGASGA